MSKSVSIFDTVGIVPARTSTNASVIGISDLLGVSQATFGLLQSFSIDSKVLAQIKRTLRRAPVIFPMGDELSDITLSYMAPLTKACPTGPSMSMKSVVSEYENRRVTPDSVTPLAVSIADVNYNCLMLGMRVDGALQGSSTIVSVTMRLAGVRI